MKNSKWKTHKIKDCLQQTETTIVNLLTIKFWPMEPWVTWQFFKSWNLDEILWLCCFRLEMFNVFLACFCHILFSRINTEMKVIFQRCQVLGTLLTISALHTVGSTWPASPKKQSCQQLFPHPSPVWTLPAFSDLLSLTKHLMNVDLSLPDFTSFESPLS